MLVFLQSLVDTNCTEIFSIEQQIAALQERIKSLQSHNQALGSVDGAIDSMFAQIDTAFKMVASVCPEQFERLKEAVNECVEKVGFTSPEALPEQVEPDESGSQTIEAEIVDESQEEESSIEPEPQLETDSNGNGKLSKEELASRFDRAALLKLAKGRITGKLNRLSKDDLTTALDGMITEEDATPGLG